MITQLELEEVVEGWSDSRRIILDRASIADLAKRLVFEIHSNDNRALWDDMKRYRRWFEMA